LIYIALKESIFKEINVIFIKIKENDEKRVENFVLRDENPMPTKISPRRSF